MERLQKLRDMERSRSAKRRKVNGPKEKKKNENGGSIDIESPSHEIVSGLNGDTSPMDIDQDGSAAFATPTKSNLRRKSSGRELVTESETLEDGANKENDDDAETNTPSVRSSGRQRKAPQRLEDEIHEVKRTRSTRKTTGTPSKKTSFDETPRHSVVSDEEDSSLLIKPKTTTPRKRAKRQSVRFSTTEVESNHVVNGDGGGFDDDTDDIVNAQLQQDLLQELASSEEHATSVKVLPDYAEKFERLCESNLRDELNVLTRLILEKLSGKRMIPLKGIDSEYQKVFHLMEQTVTASEGNSMLIMGSRGCGKTAVIESIISTLSKDHKDDFHVVRLNGFLHTDDRLALREIWRQLGRETNTEDESAKINSYADTMSTLLALLSHPEELYGSNGSSDAIATAKSVVIILDEFDLFATHPRQTLLYNLFDIAQARKAPLAVIGVTTKVDVTETLEKRVKSRFSHRYVFLPLPKTLNIFSEICLAALEVDERELLNSSTAGNVLDTSPLMTSNGRLLLEGWGEYLQGLWNDEDFNCHLKRIYYQSKSVKDFLTSAFLPLSSLHHSSSERASRLEIPVPNSFTSQSLNCPDPAPLPFLASMTGSASTTSLPLSLLLAATRLTALYDPGSNSGAMGALALSFPAAYAEYVRLLTSAKAKASISGAAAIPGRIWGRDVAREAWEKLGHWGLVVPLGAGNGTTDGRMFRVEVSFEEVSEMVNTGGSLGRWWRD